MALSINALRFAKSSLVTAASLFWMASLLYLLYKAAHRGKSGGTGGGLAPVDAANQILCFFNPFHPLS